MSFNEASHRLLATSGELLLGVIKRHHGHPNEIRSHFSNAINSPGALPKGLSRSRSIWRLSSTSLTAQVETQEAHADRVLRAAQTGLVLNPPDKNKFNISYEAVELLVTLQDDDMPHPIQKSLRA